MSRYIKFDDAVKVMACEMYAEAQSQGYDVDGIEDFMPEAKAWMADAPSIDIEPKRGEWIDKGKNLWECSNCEMVIYSESEQDRNEFHKWCSRCGSRMKGADDE